MARRRRSVIGETQPWQDAGGIVTGPGAAPSPPMRTLDAPLGSIIFYSLRPDVQVIGKAQEDAFEIVSGGPQHDVSDRPGRVGVPTFTGHEPIRMNVSVVLNVYPRYDPRSVMTRLRALERLGQRLDDWTLPLIRVAGPVPYSDRQWERTGALVFDDEPTPINTMDGWLRLPITVPLIEHVSDATLQQSVLRSQRGSGAKNGPHFTRVRRGEHGFGDVSKRLYGTRSRAGELARANDKPIGTRLHVGDRIRTV